MTHTVTRETVKPHSWTKALQELRSNLKGEMILPEDSKYEEARKVYNAMIDKRPQLIVRCSNVADVIYTVKFAKGNSLLLAVRGGGHSFPGFGTSDGGVVLDLSLMKSVRVDPRERTVRVEGGCTLRDVDHATHAFGLAIPSGIVGTTGVAGLTLGGGQGYLTRAFGLAIDNLLEADVVVADGRLVTASKEENEDLFWALRGGGGNFGVVTSFLFKAYPISTVYAGPMLWTLDKADEVMRWYRNFCSNAQEDLYGFFAFLNVPSQPPFPQALHGRRVCGIIWCYIGPQDKAHEALSPVKQISPPVVDFVGPIPYPTLTGLFDQIIPKGLQWYNKADFENELTDQAIKTHLEFGSKLPTPLSTVHFYPIDGAAARVGRDETAFWHRGVKWSIGISGCDPDPANRERITRWAKEYWDALRPYSVGEGYVNFMMQEGHQRVQTTYGDNYNKLSRIKRKYDPTNLFKVNQNIQPS